jgi:hypothetical protein
MTINGRKAQSHGKAGRQTPTQILYTYMFVFDTFYGRYKGKGTVA